MTEGVGFQKKIPILLCLPLTNKDPQNDIMLHVALGYLRGGIRRCCNRIVFDFTNFVLDSEVGLLK